MTNQNCISTKSSRRSFLKIAGAGSLALMAPATSVPAAAALSAEAPGATKTAKQNPELTQLNPDPDSLTAIGNTPLMKLNHLPDENGAEIWVKWEGANPTGSMKDRMALGMIEAAEKSTKF